MRQMSIQVVMIIALSAGCVGQTPGRYLELEKEAAKQKVVDASSRLRFSDEASYREYLAQRDRLTIEIHSVVNAFLLASAEREELTQRTQENLREVLAGAWGDAEFASPPSVWLDETKSATALVVGYTLLRGGGIDDPTSVLRGYRNISGQINLVDTTGRDFDGYGFFTRRLLSPVPGETWILAWGNRAGFNGRMIRARLFAFDGDKFQTLWDPDDMFDAEFEFSTNGFSVTHIDSKRRQDGRFYLRDTYLLGAGGPALQMSVPTGLQ